MGRDGDRDCFRDLSRRPSLKAAVVIGARIEPALNLDKPISQVPAKLHCLWAITPRVPAVDRCQRDHEQVAQVLRTQKIRLPRLLEFTCVIHHSS